MFFFTADEHYGHRNIIKYCDRPFNDINEMDNIIVKRHNEIVKENDLVIHAGDFTLESKERAQYYIRKLNGSHIFLKGSHDYWINTKKQILEEKIHGQWVIVCHYAMRVWPKSHYNSWQLFGHSHGKLKPNGKQWDIGVDNNDFYPVSFNQILEIMNQRPDNFNLIKKIKKEKVN